MGRRRRPRQGGGPVTVDRNSYRRLGYGSALHPMAGEIKPPAADTTIRTEQTAGRNDPCPCGSGRKYKKCCLS